MRTLVNFFGKPFRITGRTGRRGFWRSVFSYVLVVAVLALAPFPQRLLVNISILLLTILLVLAVVRRLRDTGMSAWLVLLPLAPVVGAFALIGLLARPSVFGTHDVPEKPPGIVGGALEGGLEIARCCGAVLDYLVVFIGWMGQGMNGPITQYCRKCHRRVYPAGVLYCDQCLLDVRWGEDELREGPPRQ